MWPTHQDIKQVCFFFKQHGFLVTSQIATDVLAQSNWTDDATVVRSGVSRGRRRPVSPGSGHLFPAPASFWAWPRLYGGLSCGFSLILTLDFLLQAPPGYNPPSPPHLKTLSLTHLQTTPWSIYINAGPSPRARSAPPRL